jgi:hypothetical protein
MGLIVYKRNGNKLIACFFLIVFYAMMRWGRRDLILSDLGRTRKLMCIPNVSKNDDDNGNGKRLGAFLFQLRFAQR